MKNKKIIEIINRFPKTLKNIKGMISEENVDYILDASGYSRPVSLLAQVSPDMLVLNLKLPRNAAINLVGSNMQDSMDLKMGMITSNARAFYISLCTTLDSAYFIDRSSTLELIPEIVSKQQLN
jgi:DNA-binding NarL/FixJ family response regulator